MSSIGRLRQTLLMSDTVRTGVSSALIVLVRVGGTAVTFAYTLLIARVMSPHDVGVVWAIWSSSFIVSTLTTLNIGGAAVRDVVRARALGDDDLAAGFVHVSRRVLLCATPFVMAGFLLFYWFADPAFDTYLWAYLAATLSLPVMGWVQVNASQAAALNRAFYSQAPRELMRPLVFLIAFGIAVALGWHASVGFAVAIYLVATILTAYAQFVLLRPSFGFMRNAKPRMTEWRHWIGTGLLLTPSRILGEHLKNLLVVAAAIGLPESDTARFAVALSLISFLNFGLSAVEMTFSPKISGAMAAGKTWQRDSMLAVSGYLKTAPVALAAIILALVAKPVLGLFGHAYADAAPVILWFLLIPLSRAVFGSSDLILQVERDRKTIFLNALVNLLLIGIAVPLIGSRYGLNAAAAAASLACVWGRFQLWLVCYRRTGIDTSIVASTRFFLRRFTQRRKSAG